MQTIVAGGYTISPSAHFAFILADISILTTSTCLDYAEEIEELQTWFALVDWWELSRYL